ncbi:MAG: serine endoprotease DegQ, partial [Gammaproteobacteria bacterium]|nr:serine endoprotease DegQ [Gammaproteobacteria bacterium]
MRTIIGKLVVLFALSLAVSSISQAALPAFFDGKPMPTLAPMLEKTTPAVVNIATRSTRTLPRNPLLDDPFFRQFFDVPERPRERTSQSLGSGVIVNAKDGYIITNHHVIDGADEITVTLSDGR